MALKYHEDLQSEIKYKYKQISSRELFFVWISFGLRHLSQLTVIPVSLSHQECNIGLSWQIVLSYLDTGLISCNSFVVTFYFIWRHFATAAQSGPQEGVMSFVADEPHHLHIIWRHSATRCHYRCEGIEPQFYEINLLTLPQLVVAVMMLGPRYSIRVDPSHPTVNLHPTHPGSN